MMMNPRVQDVKPNSDYTLTLTFDKKIKIFDTSHTWTKAYSENYETRAYSTLSSLAWGAFNGKMGKIFVRIRCIWMGWKDNSLLFGC
jgi:hypothetical protein